MATVKFIDMNSEDQVSENTEEMEGNYDMGF